MSAISSVMGQLPGMDSEVYEFQSAFTWGPQWLNRYTSAQIYSGALDSGNTPTSTLRMGLVMGKITSSGMWTNYSPTATDGSQLALGILGPSLRMANVITGSTQNKWYNVMVGGGLKAAGLIGIDNLARQQLADHFIFDDNLAGLFFPFSRWSTKTQAVSPYQILASDNRTLFDTTGATGSVTFTLPALANGYFFGFRAAAAQNMIVASLAGNDMIALDDLTASSVAFQTGSQQIGGIFWIYSNPGATAWVVENHSAGTNTITKT